jgi:hypothetical protein
MDTTKERVLTLAPELSVITDDDLWTMILEDVSLQVKYDVYGDNEERAQKYLAAHLLTLHVNASNGSASATGGVQKAKTGQVEASYADISKSLSDASRYDETSYGRQFMLIRKRSIVTPRVYTI